MFKRIPWEQKSLGEKLCLIFALLGMVILFALGVFLAFARPGLPQRAPSTNEALHITPTPVPNSNGMIIIPGNGTQPSPVPSPVPAIREGDVGILSGDYRLLVDSVIKKRFSDYKRPAPKLAEDLLNNHAWMQAITLKASSGKIYGVRSLRNSAAYKPFEPLADGLIALDGSYQYSQRALLSLIDLLPYNDVKHYVFMVFQTNRTNYLYLAYYGDKVPTGEAPTEEIPPVATQATTASSNPKKS